MCLYKEIKIEKVIKEHSTLLAKLRETCQDYIEKDSKQFDDDLFLVRFCIAHKGDFEKTSSALRECIDWRIKNKETLEKMATTAGWRSPTETKVRQYALSRVHGQTKDGSPILIVDGGRTNLTLLMKHCTVDEILEVELLEKERLYQTCIQESRKQGRIVGFVSLQTQKHGSMWDFDRKYVGALSTAAKQIDEVYYPTLCQYVVICNGLSILRAMMACAALILPASMTEKIHVCGAKSTMTGDITDCPVVGGGSVFDLDVLPSCFGGKCTCSDKGGCFGIPNESKEKVKEGDIVAE